MRVEGWSTAGLFEDYLASVGDGEFHIKREVSVGGVRLLRTYYHGGVDFRRVPAMVSGAAAAGGVGGAGGAGDQRGKGGRRTFFKAENQR